MYENCAQYLGPFTSGVSLPLNMILYAGVSPNKKVCPLLCADNVHQHWNIVPHHYRCPKLAPAPGEQNFFAKLGSLDGPKTWTSASNIFKPWSPGGRTPPECALGVFPPRRTPRGAPLYKGAEPKWFLPPLRGSFKARFAPKNCQKSVGGSPCLNPGVRMWTKCPVGLSFAKCS